MRTSITDPYGVASDARVESIQGRWRPEPQHQGGSLLVARGGSTSASPWGLRIRISPGARPGPAACWCTTTTSASFTTISTPICSRCAAGRSAARSARSTCPQESGCPRLPDAHDERTGAPRGFGARQSRGSSRAPLCQQAPLALAHRLVRRRGAGAAERRLAPRVLYRAVGGLYVFRGSSARAAAHVRRRVGLRASGELTGGGSIATRGPWHDQGRSLHLELPLDGLLPPDCRHTDHRRFKMEVGSLEARLACRRASRDRDTHLRAGAQSRWGSTRSLPAARSAPARADRRSPHPPVRGFARRAPCGEAGQDEARHLHGTPLPRGATAPAAAPVRGRSLRGALAGRRRDLALKRDARHLHRRLRLPPGPCRADRAWHRPDPVRPDATRRGGALGAGTGGKLVFGAISKHFWVKNLDALVRAFSVIAEREPGRASRGPRDRRPSSLARARGDLGLSGAGQRPRSAPRRSQGTRGLRRLRAPGAGRVVRACGSRGHGDAPPGRGHAGRYRRRRDRGWRERHPHCGDRSRLAGRGDDPCPRNGATGGRSSAQRLVAGR